jgi:hypothetical protein
MKVLVFVSHSQVSTAPVRDDVVLVDRRGDVIWCFLIDRLEEYIVARTRTRFYTVSFTLTRVIDSGTIHWQRRRMNKLLFDNQIQVIRLAAAWRLTNLIIKIRFLL